MVHLFSGSVGAVLRVQSARDTSQTSSGSGASYFDAVSSIGTLLSSSDLSDTRSFVGLSWWDVDDSYTISVSPDLTPLAAQVSYAGSGDDVNASGTSDSRL